MVPMAGQDAVPHGTLIHGKAHVRAAIVYSVNLVLMPHQGHHAISHRGGNQALLLHVRQRQGSDKVI